MKDLTAENMKEALWEVLNAVKDENMSPATADSAATQAREILRTVNTQIRVAQHSKRPLPVQVISFSEK